VLVGVNHYGSLEWLFLGLLGAACLFLGRKDPRYGGLGWLASVAGAALLLSWSSNLKIADLGSFTWTALGYGGLMALGAYACMWGARKAARWAALSAASAIVYLLLVYQGWTIAGGSLHWGIPTLCLAVLFLVLALPVANRRRILPEGETALAALAVAVTTFVSLAVPMELERQWLAVAWALEVAALVWIAGRLAVPALRTLAWLVALLVAVRLLMNPYVLTYPIGKTPVVNWLLYGYGIPILAFAVAAWMCRRDGDIRLSEGLHWGAEALAVAMIALEVRHYFHPEKLDAPKAYLAEWGTLTVAWMLLGLGLLLASRAWPHRSLDWGGRAVFALAVLQCALAQVLGANPLWWHHPVGQTPVFNALLWVYGVPAVLCLLAAWELDRRGEVAMPRVLGVTALGLSFLLLTLEIRQAFQGAYLDRHGMSSAEKYAYSIAWVLFGTVLLVVGILKRGAVMRYASLAVMLLAVGKVFLYDLSQLKDLYRVFSLIGLGLSLLLLAFLYQRYVFSRGKP
jgi:uncharacterized membrane protein